MPLSKIIAHSDSKHLAPSPHATAHLFHSKPIFNLTIDDFYYLCLQGASLQLNWASEEPITKRNVTIYTMLTKNLLAPLQPPRTTFAVTLRAFFRLYKNKSQTIKEIETFKQLSTQTDLSPNTLIKKAIELGKKRLKSGQPSHIKTLTCSFPFFSVLLFLYGEIGADRYIEEINEKSPKPLPENEVNALKKILSVSFSSLSQQEQQTTYSQVSYYQPFL